MLKEKHHRTLTISKYMSGKLNLVNLILNIIQIGKYTCTARVAFYTV